MVRQAKIASQSDFLRTQFDGNTEYYALVLANYNPKEAKQVQEHCSNYEIARAYWMRAIDRGIREIDG